MSDAIGPRALERVEELLSIYAAADSAAATLLCDRHDPAAIAYRIVAPDMSVDVLTYGALRTESERFADVLRSLGVAPGDRVATLMGKGRRYLVALMGIWRLGAVHVPLFTAFAPPAIAYRLSGSGARVVVCDAKQEAKLAPGEDIPADAPWKAITTGPGHGALLSYDVLMEQAKPGMAAAALGGQAPLIHIYTSGTTGSPKGVVIPIRALAAFRAYAEFAFGLEPADVFWCAADPGWAYGLYFGVLCTFTTGQPSIMFEGNFSPETTLAVLAQEHVTNFAAAPTVYRSLRSADVPIPPGIRLRCASSAGEPLTPEVNEWAERALGVPVHDHYGQTEMGMMIANHHHPDLKRPLKSGSMGQAMPGWTAVILKEDRDELAAVDQLGRVAIDLQKSPLAFFEGYFNEPEKSAEKFVGGGRYYVTGDVGSVDSEGYFHFASRDDDVILMAGYRIGPFEVESVLQAHPQVRESAVIAVPDEVRGEVMEAYVVPCEGVQGSPELEEDLKRWVKTRYAAHAFPRRIHFVAELPKTPSGKVQRNILRQRRRAQMAEAGHGAG